jgi:DNA repair protein RecO (recombination protein O)
MASPRVYRAHAIVLRRINLGETDKILTLLTREKGKLSAVAKGARRPASRLAGATELFNYCRAMLAVGQSLDVVTQVEVRQSFPALRRNLEKIAAASYLTELVDHFSEERLPQPEIFDLLLSGLYVLNTQEDAGLLVAAFSLQLLVMAGYTPVFSNCARCHRADVGLTAFSAAMGGAVCRDCRASVKDSMYVAAESVDAARALLAWELPQAARLELDNRARGQVLKIVRAFLLYRSDRPLKSARFLDELLAARALSDAESADVSQPAG